MFEYTLTKRFAAACLVLLLALPCVTTYAEDAPESSAPPPIEAEVPAPSESPAPIETETPPPAETETPPPVETETPAPIETEPPPPAETATPAPTAAPTPTATPAPPEPAQPEYTIDSALSYLAENGVLLAASPVPETVADNTVATHEMHRLYLGQTSTDGVLTLDMSQLLPGLYHRLTVDNFCAVPASFAMVSAFDVKTASLGEFSYNSSTGILTCPYLYKKEVQKGNACFALFNIYCYYNDSVPASYAEVPTVTTRSCLGTENVGSDIELPNFPGLHMRYLKNAVSTATVDGYLNETFPDLYTSFSSDNLGVSPYAALWATVSSGIHNPPIPYNTTTGHYYVYPFTGTHNPLMSATNKEFIAFNYDLLLYYNVESEMVFEEPAPTPSPTPAPGGETDVPVSAPHPFWTTPFEEYTVSEGLLLLTFALLAVLALIKLFGR